MMFSKIDLDSNSFYFTFMRFLNNNSENNYRDKL